MNSSRVSTGGNGGALTSIPSMLINHRFSLTHWCTICSCTLRPRGSPLRGRTGRSSSRNSLHTLTTFIRSVSYVSTRKLYLMLALLPPGFEVHFLSRKKSRQRAGALRPDRHYRSYLIRILSFRIRLRWDVPGAMNSRQHPVNRKEK